MYLCPAGHDPSAGVGDCKRAEFQIKATSTQPQTPPYTMEPERTPAMVACSQGYVGSMSTQQGGTYQVTCIDHASGKPTGTTTFNSPSGYKGLIFVPQ